jgi:outer membrane receptor protein involved in Fe transport
MQRFGGFLGGPIVKDRLHYFGSYEGLRQSETSVVTSKLVPVDQREFPDDNRQNMYFVKADYRMNDANSMWARYRMDDAKEFGSGIGGLNTRDRGIDTIGRNQDIALNHTAVISAHALQEFRFQYGRQLADNLPYLPLGTPSVNRPSGNFGKAYNMPQGRTENHYQFVENFSYSVGAHDMKAGAVVDFVRVPAFFYNNVDGTFTFRTDLPFDANNPATFPSLFTQNIGSAFTHRDTDLYTTFLQDSWRVRRNVTLNLGVRYDLETAYKKATGVDDDRNNVVPRLGFAWDPFGDGRTAVRGGYGWYVDQVFLNLTANIQQARNFTGVTIVNPGYPDPYSRGAAAPEKPSTVVVSPSVQTPETRQMSIGVKR